MAEHFLYSRGAEDFLVLSEKLLAKTPQAPLMTLPELPFMATRQQHTVGLRLQKVAEPINRCNVLVQGVTFLSDMIACLPTQKYIMWVTHRPNAKSVKAGAQGSHCGPRHVGKAYSMWDRCTMQAPHCCSRVQFEAMLPEESPFMLSIQFLKAYLIQRQCL